MSGSKKRRASRWMYSSVFSAKSSSSTPMALRAASSRSSRSAVVITWPVGHQLLAAPDLTAGDPEHRRPRRISSSSSGLSTSMSGIPASTTRSGPMLG